MATKNRETAPPEEPPETPAAAATETPAATNGAKRVTRTIEIEIDEEFAEKPDAWDHETLADRVEAARALLKEHDFISDVEDVKVRRRITKAMFGPLAAE